MSLNVQYGCGLSAPDGWKNFDSSPTLRLQKLPLIGRFIKKVEFSPRILYGDILKRLPGISLQSCDAIYCSHVLEHLCLEDCRAAIQNTFNLLKEEGVFRCVVPDLESAINKYTDRLNSGVLTAGNSFMYDTLLGIDRRPKSLKEKIIFLLGNSHHLWMWDKYTLEEELKNAGFSSVRMCFFNDSINKDFYYVEEISRFNGAIAFEAIK